MHSTGFTVMFAGAVCVVCSVFVAGSAVLLRDKQETNKVLDRQSKVLDVAGLIEPGVTLSPAEITSRYAENIEPVVIDLATGEAVDGVEPSEFDQQKAQRDPSTSRTAPPNDAKVVRVPNQAVVYRIKQGEELMGLIVPVEGKGLWSTLYGFLALEADAQTVKGLTFYEHGETPGLGGEVDNPRWKSLWRGRKAFNDEGVPAIEVVKGQAPPPEEAPYEVDGLSGATITSRGVTYLVQFWLGENGYGPYLDNYRKQLAVN